MHRWTVYSLSDQESMAKTDRKRILCTLCESIFSGVIDKSYQQNVRCIFYGFVKKVHFACDELLSVEGDTRVAGISHCHDDCVCTTVKAVDHGL